MSLRSLGELKWHKTPVAYTASSMPGSTSPPPDPESPVPVQVSVVIGGNIECKEDPVEVHP